MKARLEAARASQVAWGHLDHRDRAGYLKSLRITIAQQAQQWVDAIHADTGKPRLDAMSGDVYTTLELIKYYERTAAKVLQRRRLGQPRLFFWKCRFYEELCARGAVLVISPWNYPLQLSLIPVFTALFAGNAVILKPSEVTPRTNQLIQRLFEDSALPASLVQVIEGGAEVATALIEAKPDHIFFTGSSKNGLAIARRATEDLIPHCLEMGGKDVMVVLEDAQLDRAIRGATYGGFSNAGQVCVGVKRLLLHDSIAAAFIPRFVAEVQALRVGLAPQSDFGPMTRALDVENTLAQVQDALDYGAVALTEIHSEGRQLHPIVLTQVSPDCRVMNEEVFGPVVCIETFSSEAEAVQLANSGRFGLNASVWSRSMPRARAVASALVVGGCSINDVIRHLANPHAPFGGEKFSGQGRYHGAEGLLSFSRRKTIMENTNQTPAERNWFPYNEQILTWMNRWIRFRHLPLTWLMFSLVNPPTAQAAEMRRGTIELRIHHLATGGGQLAYSVHNRASTFPDRAKEAVRTGFVEIESTTDCEMSFRIENLAFGEYAISVFQDMNRNGKLDKNWIGIPKEPVGASANPTGRLGPPRYSDCKFRLYASELTLDIDLVQ